MRDQSMQQQAIISKGLTKESVEMLTYILTEIYNRNINKRNKAEDVLSNGEGVKEKEEKKNSNLLEILFRNSCLAVLSRSAAERILYDPL